MICYIHQSNYIYAHIFWSALLSECLQLLAMMTTSFWLRFQPCRNVSTSVFVGGQKSVYFVLLFLPLVMLSSFASGMGQSLQASQVDSWRASKCFFHWQNHRQSVNQLTSVNQRLNYKLARYTQFRSYSSPKSWGSAPQHWEPPNLLVSSKRPWRTENLAMSTRVWKSLIPVKFIWIRLSHESSMLLAAATAGDLWGSAPLWHHARVLHVVPENKQGFSMGFLPSNKWTNTVHAPYDSLFVH